MTLAQGAFLCLVLVSPIIVAVVIEWRSLNRVIAGLCDLPDDQYMNLHEAGGRRKETLSEHVPTTGAVNLLAGSGSKFCEAIASRTPDHAPPPQLVGEAFAHGPCAMCQSKFLQARGDFAIVVSTFSGDS